MSDIIKIENFKYQNIFENLNISIKEHSFTAITGPNNCGKTTLMRILNRTIITDNYKISSGDEKNIDCDLPDSLHIEILKHAVDLYRNSLIGSIATKQAQAQNQAMENLRDNIR